MRGKVRHHKALADLAASQHGVVGRSQLIGLGYSDGAIARAEAAGWLHRLYQGAYAVGHPAPSRHGHYLAAVLACGEGALISHGSAAWLWGVSREYLARPHVTTPARGHCRSAIHRHHSTILEKEDRAVREGIPVTAVARTLLDLSAMLPVHRLGWVVERTEQRGLLDLEAIDVLIGRSGRHAGRKRLRESLEIYRDPAMARSRHERLFIALIKRAGLPRPAMNYFVAGYEVDAYWERERFAVELDAYSTHGTRVAFERDPVRIEDLKLHGIDAIRITARRLEREPDELARRLKFLLERRRREIKPTDRT